MIALTFFLLLVILVVCRQEAVEIVERLIWWLRK